MALENMTGTELRASPYPVILHVKTSVAADKFDHYVLFLGTRDQKALVLDPPGPASLVSFAELAPLWDGIGIVVSSQPVDTAVIFSTATLKICMPGTARRPGQDRPPVCETSKHGAHGLGQPRLLETCRPRPCRNLPILGAMAYHALADEGIFANRNAVTATARAYRGTFAPTVNFREASRLLAAQATFVDARVPRDFDAGHIPGAISLPVNADPRRS